MNFSFQEEENINISENYFNFIKQLSEDYLKYITNYKVATEEYLKKLASIQEKYGSRLLETNDHLKKINSNHIISLTSIIPKVVEQQIINIEFFVEEIDNKLINFDKYIKEKNIKYIEFQSPFKEIKNELVKKYKEIDKLKTNYMTNIEFAEETIHKFYVKQNSKKIKSSPKLNLIPLESSIEINGSFEE